MCQRLCRVTPGVLVLVWLVGFLALLAAGCGGGSTSIELEVTSLSSPTTGQSTGTTYVTRSPPSRPAYDQAAQSDEDSRPTGASSTSSSSLSTTGHPPGSSSSGTTATTGTGNRTTTVSRTTTTAGGPVVLTVVGPSATREFSLAELQAMTATSGWGGWKNQVGNITAPMSWRGVSIASLMELVGGGSSVIVRASDGYEQQFSAAEIHGGVVTYHPVTGQTITSISGNLRAIIAYSLNGQGLPSDQGPLRLAFVSPQNEQVTDGSNWVKLVNRLTVR